MSQFDFATLIPTQVSGTQLADKLNQFRGAQNSSHSGTGRPPYAVPGMCWLDTSSEPWQLKLFDGNDDIVFMQIDPTGNGPVLVLGAEAAVASDATVNLAQQKTNLVRITGTDAISSFGAAPPGIMRFVKFTGSLALTQSANLDLPGGADIQTAIGDQALFMAMGGSAWRCQSYTRANGSTTVNRDASVAEYRGKADKLITSKTAFDAAAYVLLSPTSTIVVNQALGFNFKVQLTGSHVLAYPTNPSPGQTGRIRVYQPGGCYLGFASGYVFSNGIAPSISSYAGWWFLDYFTDESFTHIMASRL